MKTGKVIRSPQFRRVYSYYTEITDFEILIQYDFAGLCVRIIPV